MPLDPRIQAALDAPLTVGGSIDGFGLVERVRNRGYAATPGTGPARETCRSCRYVYFVQPSVKRFYKCRLTRFTGGPASDVKVKSPACRSWEARTDG
jgi:hypothetical protein